MTVRILIAEDNDMSRDMMSAIFKTRGYEVVEALDGQGAIEAVRNQNIDVALVDLNMAPMGGFQFIEYLIAQGSKIPVVVVTGDDSSDMLVRASALGVVQVVQKPTEPNRLLEIVTRILRRAGINPSPLTVESRGVALTPEDLMKKAIALAEKNAKSGRGRPFGAVVSDKDGYVLGEGVNGISSRVDPTAHAEVMAIRQAAERIDKSDLSECVLYCTSEPTMMGKALIISVGITQVYFGLSHEEINGIRSDDDKARAVMTYTPGEAKYEQICHDEAVQMFKDVI